MQVKITKQNHSGDVAAVTFRAGRVSPYSGTLTLEDGRRFELMHDSVTTDDDARIDSVLVLVGDRPVFRLTRVTWLTGPFAGEDELWTGRVGRDGPMRAGRHPAVAAARLIWLAL